MATTDNSGIEAAIEAVIQQHVSAYEASLREALGRKFAADSGRSSRGRKRRSVPRPRTASGPRRSAGELAALGERFFEAVEQCPGETMTTLSAKLGLRTQELERPVLLLKKDGRIRTVGERSRTRYYAMTAPPAA